jgi:hypothetical protein
MAVVPNLIDRIEHGDPAVLVDPPDEVSISYAATRLYDMFKDPDNPISKRELQLIYDENDDEGGGKLDTTELANCVIALLRSARMVYQSDAALAMEAKDAAAEFKDLMTFFRLPDGQESLQERFDPELAEEIKVDFFVDEFPHYLAELAGQQRAELPGEALADEGIETELEGAGAEDGASPETFDLEKGQGGTSKKSKKKVCHQHP